MKREAVAYAAVFAAALSVGALGFAVVWGIDVSELTPPSAVTVAPPQSAPLTPPVEVAKPVEPPAPASPAASADGPPQPSTGPRPVEVATPLPSPPSPPAAASVEALPKQSVAPPAPRIPGEDARALRAASVRATHPSPAVDRPLPDATVATSALLPQMASIEPEIEAPASLPESEPIATAPPAGQRVPSAEQGHANTGAPKLAAVPPGSEGLRAMTSAHPHAALIAPESQREPPRRPARPRERVQASNSVVVIRGAPPVPSGFPGIVQPGPLIIHLPPRR